MEKTADQENDKKRIGIFTLKGRSLRRKRIAPESPRIGKGVKNGVVLL